MSQSLIGIALSVPNLDSMITALAKAQSQLPNTQKAVEQSTFLIQQIWQGYAYGAHVTYSGGTFTVSDPTGEYARSIQRQAPYRGRGSGIVFSTSPIARRIEEGVQPYDMKPGFLRSPKAKVGKNGNRYITIPFRHNTPGNSATGPSMPTSIYNQAKRLDFSSVTGRNPWGQSTYQWGGRIPATPLGQRSKLPTGGMTAPYTWKTGLYSGMVRMGTPGGKRSSGYLTFRRVSAKSDPNSWWNPGRKGQPVRQAVVEKTQPEVMRMLKTGFALDLAMAGLPIPPDLR